MMLPMKEKAVKRKTHARMLPFCALALASQMCAGMDFEVKKDIPYYSPEVCTNASMSQVLPTCLAPIRISGLRLRPLFQSMILLYASLCMDFPSARIIPQSDHVIPSKNVMGNHIIPSKNVIP